MLTALLAPLLLLTGGFAIDYGYASYLNQRLTQATDNAVLASVSQSAATAGGGFSNTGWLQSYGSAVFRNNISDLPVSGAEFKLIVTSNGTGGVDSVGSYTYNYPNFFGSLIGRSAMPLANQIRASANPVTYIDYYILVDVSQSMGIGATQQDMNALWQRGLSRGAGAFGEQCCVFGCHVKSPGQTGSQTNEEIAHSASPPIQLRIDAAVAAVKNIIVAAQQNAGTNKNIRIGLYTLTRDVSKSSVSYTVVAKPSSDYATLVAMAGTIDLGNNTPSIGDSDLPASLSAFSNQLPAGDGSGASAVSPRNYVFLITDGLNDSGNLATCLYYGNTCTKPIVASNCDAIKLRATLGVIYTVYNPIYQNNDRKLGLEALLFKPLVAPFLTIDKTSGQVTYDSMAEGLKGCSSDPGKYYFPASDGPAIDSQMRALFASTLRNARLTH